MRFHTEIVGLKHLRTVAHGMMAFFDAAGVCVILVPARSVRTREAAIGASLADASSSPQWDAPADFTERPLL
jgi:hypothetical protein